MENTLSGPKGYPIVGNLIDRLRDPLGFFTKVYNEYGNFVYIPMLNFDTYLVSEPCLVREILQKKDLFLKGKNYDGVRKFLGDGILTSNFESWNKQRKYLTPIFRHEAVNSYLPIFKSCTQNTIEKLFKTTSSPSFTIDIRESITHLTIEVVARAVFSSSLPQADISELAELVSELAQLSSKYIFRVLRAPDWLPTPLNRAIQQNKSRLDQILFNTFKQQIPQLSPDQTLPLNEIRDQVISLFLAGHETTASTLVWCFWHIANDLHLQDQCLREIQNQQDRILKAIIQECLRLYPPVWIFPRETTEKTHLGGVTLNKGSIVLVCPYVLHRSPHHWAHPNKFDPARFLSNRSPDKYVYLPFSAGPRSCLGENFAMQEMLVILKEFIANFEFTPANLSEKTLDPSVTLRPVGNFNLQFRRRQNRHIIDQINWQSPLATL